MRRKIVAVIGASEPSKQERELAYSVGNLIAKKKLVLLNGGLGGVMAESARGAKEAGGTVIGILPVANPDEANKHIDYAIATGIGDARNAVIANTADCFIAIGKSLGTLSEIAFALKRGKYVIGLETWQVEGIQHISGAKKAVNTCCKFLQKSK